MSANLLDPRLHRRAGADYFDALVADGTLIGTLTATGRGVASDGHDITVQDGLLGTAGGGAPVDVNGLYTAWVVVVGQGQLVYLGLNTESPDSSRGNDDYPVGKADSGGTLLLRTFYPRDLSSTDDDTFAGIGFDIGNDVGSSTPFEILDVGLVRGRVPLTSVRHRRRVKLV